MKRGTLDFTACTTPDDILRAFESSLDISECDDEFGIVWHHLVAETEGDMCFEIRGLYSLPACLEEYRRRIIEVIDDIDDISPNVTFVIVS